MYSGGVTSITPAAIKAGLPVNLIVSWWASTDDPLQVLFGWHAKIKIELDGLIGEREFFVKLRSVQPFNNMKVVVGPDVMPDYNLNGYISVECRNGASATPYYEPITITSLGIPDGNGEPPDGGELPLIPIAIGAGVLLVALAAITKKR